MFTLLLMALTLGAQAQQTFTVSVTNPLTTARADQPVVISLTPFGDIRSVLVTTCGQEIPCQLDDLNQDDTFDELCFLADLNGDETKLYEVTLLSEGENNFIESITARGDCADSYHIQHHHGVEFESELNGIRIYFDKRQTLDLYGKFQKRLELQATQFYTSKEQKAEGYGDDVLWVGNTFGLGAFRGWDGQQPTMIDPVRSRTQRIISYGPLRTIVELYDRGWQRVNMTIRYTQYAGHRDTDVDVFFNKNVSDRLFSTGVINVKGSVEFSDHKGLRACWGTDYPSTDTIKWKRETVGLAVCIPQKCIRSEEPANKDNYAFVVATPDYHIAYKVIYTSANETFGYHSSQEWFEFLKEWKKEVLKPIQVKY